MSIHTINIKHTVASFLTTVMFSLPVAAQDSSDTDLLQDLREAEPAQAARIERRIINEWSKSGSAAMDLLLKRGRDALETRKLDTAIGHFTALTDHAPDFAEGWHGLALAYYNADMFGPALDALERTLALNPHHFGALRGLAATMEQVGQPELAYRAYTQVLELNPHDSDVAEAIKRLEPKVTGTTL